MENDQSQVQDSNQLPAQEEDFGLLGDVMVEESGQEQEELTQNRSLKRKDPSLRSKYWKEFESVEVMDDGDPPKKVRKGKCKRCGRLIAADSKTIGTSGLKHHSESCLRNHLRNSGQTLLSFEGGSHGTGSGSLTNWRFDQGKSRLKLCEMIICDELPFKFVEREGFTAFVESLCPLFKIPSRNTVRTDSVKLFLERKISLKSFFQAKGIGRVFVTTDCWTSINNTSFICVTAHFIDKDWVLHKRIISFRKIYGHMGDDIGVAVINSLDDWGLQNLLCCTMDNALANEGAIKFMKCCLERWKTTVAGGLYVHMRCVAHIINLIVSSGLEEIGLSVRRVREAVKWIKASPARSEAFKNTVTAFNIDCSKFLSLDVPTRWNSTYLMLESAQPYEKTFKFFGYTHPDFVHDMSQKRYKDGYIGVLEDSDWVNVKRMCDYLWKFYDMTLLVFGTTYVTSHLFFKEMCDIFAIINDYELDEDEQVRTMANKMKEKLGKYWLEEKEMNPKMNRLLYIAAILDPRQKLKHVEKCFKAVYDVDRAEQLVGEVKKSFIELFEMYKKSMNTSPSPIVRTSTSDLPPRPRDRSDRRGSRRVASCSLLQIGKEQSNEVVSEIDVYLSEGQHMMTTTEAQSIDILSWWRLTTPRFPIMAMMARDILAIPISSVASESAFSTGGRVLSQFRSSLTCNMVEALICVEDWLRSSPIDKILIDEEDEPESVLENEYDSVLAEFGIGGQNENVLEVGDQMMGLEDESARASHV